MQSTDTTYLVIKQPSMVDRREVIFEDEVTIGRTENNSIAIDDISVSRQHASISLGSTGHWIQDLGSRNGTRVNGQKLSAEGALLRNGDRIALGGNQVTITYYKGDVTMTAGDDTISRWGIGMPW